MENNSGTLVTHKQWPLSKQRELTMFTCRAGIATIFNITTSENTKNFGPLSPNGVPMRIFRTFFRVLKQRQIVAKVVACAQLHQK